MSSSLLLAVVLVIMSSAYVFATDHFNQNSKSETYSTKIRGEMTPPCGTPEVKFFAVEVFVPILTFCVLPVKKDLNQCWVGIHKFLSFHRNCLRLMCQIQQRGPIKGPIFLFFGPAIDTFSLLARFIFTIFHY